VPTDALRLLEIGEGILCAQGVDADVINCQLSQTSSSHPNAPRVLTLDAPNAQRLSVGAGSACALRTDERLICVGDHAPKSRPRTIEQE
jgi:hypothetical protein